MKTPTITEHWKISVGLAVVVIGGGSWWLSAFYMETKTVNAQLLEGMREMKDSIGQLVIVQTQQGKDLVEVKTTVKGMRPRVYQTQLSIGAVHEELAQLNQNLGPVVPLYQGRVTQN